VGGKLSRKIRVRSTPFACFGFEPTAIRQRTNQLDTTSKLLLWNHLRFANNRMVERTQSSAEVGHGQLEA